MQCLIDVLLPRGQAAPGLMTFDQYSVSALSGHPGRSCWELCTPYFLGGFNANVDAIRGKMRG